LSTAYLSVGSNLGDRRANISQAIDALAQRGIRVVKTSSIYETEPVGFRDQGWFLNCVVEVETSMEPEELLVSILQIEESSGRRRSAQSVPMGPRIIDIDIILFGEHIIQSDDLQIPHPRMASRKFVLVPLDEIASEAKHPRVNKTIHQLLGETPDHSIVKPWKEPT
jgi:2-amino-4-hydroxy-6-hydroxymethyldihydropteridine diphosphokinase